LAISDKNQEINPCWVVRPDDVPRDIAFLLLPQFSVIGLL
jgi:hypothetical protein